MPYKNSSSSDRFSGRALNGRNNNLGLAGQIVEIADESGNSLGFYRTIVRSQDAEAMSVELQNNYTEKAFMSWDGAFRPVSMDGEGGFPRYARCPTFADCSGCSAVSPNTFILTIEDTTAASGLQEINGIYNIPREGECLWSGNAANGLDLKIAYDGNGWNLSIDGQTSNQVSGQVACADSNDPIQFTWASPPSGYTGGTYEASGFNAITIYDLQPWQNPSGMPPWDKVPSERSDTSTIGHDLEVVGRTGTDRNSTPSGGLGMYQAGVAQGDTGVDAFDYRDDYKFMALKGPLIVHGWGYDCNGRPVPNLGDSEEATSSGVFTKDGLDDNKFLEGHLRKPHTWPVGPVDLRWDRNRCVWVSPGCGSDGVISSDGSSGEVTDCSGYATQDCACAVLDVVQSLVDILENNATIDSAEATTLNSGIATAIETCECPQSVVDCENCSGSSNQMPVAVDVTVANISNVPYPSNTSFWDFTGSDIASWLNGTHTITLDCDGIPGGQSGAPAGFVSQTFVANNYSPSNSGNNPYDVRVELWLAMQTGAQWRYTIFVNNVGEVNTPVGVLAQTSQFDGVDNSEDCIADDTADFSDAVITNTPDRYLDTSTITISTTPAP